MLYTPARGFAVSNAALAAIAHVDKLLSFFPDQERVIQDDLFSRPRSMYQNREQSAGNACWFACVSAHASTKSQRDRIETAQVSVQQANLLGRQLADCIEAAGTLANKMNRFIFGDWVRFQGGINPSRELSSS